ncbi:MAG: LacI family DNA-binding transcriptional regulator [Chloroflexi bacterium]|nr:LacI family DNA-binding transcriptional regulator [Chloroflexota bacterium]
MNDHGNGNGRLKRPITIQDVAERAGVSRQTVSRAINNKGEIRAETRARVLAAARELGYRPSSIARGLKTRRTLTLGLVVPDIANPFFAEVVRGASERADAAGYSVLLCNTDENAEREWAILRMLESHRVDGLVLISSRLSEEMLAETIARWRPIVLVNRSPQEERPGVGWVLVDDAHGARRAVRHLLERGHRKIGFLAGVPTSRSGRERLRGYREALAEAGLSAPEGWVAPCAPTVEGGREATLALLNRHPELTALLAYNDLVAVGAQQACRTLGRDIPKDCALIGWDDILFAAYVSPPLTTMRMPKMEIGQRAMELLLTLLREPEEAPAPIVLETTLIVRETT